MIALGKGFPYPMGATVGSNGIYFAAVLNPKEECGILLYPKKSVGTYRKPIKIPFAPENRMGNIFCGFLRGADPTEYEYNYYSGNEIIVDPYAKSIRGNEKWGGAKPGTLKLRAGFLKSEFDWGTLSTICRPYEESVIYCAHLRGLTRHSSSKTSFKGTFEGLIEKIPYLKDLGITAVELMPIYEFEETEEIKTKQTMDNAIKEYNGTYDSKSEGESEVRINYWGFKEAFYFAPKASYSAIGRPIESCKSMIKALHDSGIEVIMQFYFPKTVKYGYISEVIRYWITEYRIDGLHLIGENIPITFIATEPLMANTKIIYSHIPSDEIYEPGEIPGYRNLAVCNDSFMHAARKFLKSDYGTLWNFTEEKKQNPDKYGIIRNITAYNGFTLRDLVTYNEKHNEHNGENNKDGEIRNDSWNCGVEGVTRKKSINELRERQMKNALTLMMLSQGTPMIVAGDEFGNSQQGNNNPYCHDNDITWLNWNNINKYKSLHDFTKNLIALRKSHPIFMQRQEFRMIDTMSCGYPDMSYHGKEAWRPLFDDDSARHVGVLYCGKYAKGQRDETTDIFYYAAYNMHWNEQKFAFPNINDMIKWEVILDTGNSEVPYEAVVSDSVSVPGRTIRLFKGTLVLNVKKRRKTRKRSVSERIIFSHEDDKSIIDNS